jgi:hypothetical protein
MLRLHFETTVLKGATVQSYLLERSRWVESITLPLLQSFESGSATSPTRTELKFCVSWS